MMVDFAKLLRERLDPRPNSPEDLGARPSSITTAASIGPPPAFVKLAGQLVEAAFKIPCSRDDRIAGLRFVLSEIEVALQAEKEES